MELYAPGEVYTNLNQMMIRRGVVLADPELSTDQVAQKLNHYEFVTIAGTRPATDPRGKATVVSVLIAPNSKYSNKTGDFKKLLKGLPKTNDTLDVIFVSEKTLTVHIKKQLETFKKENPSIIVEDHDYNLFIIDPMRHVSVPPHSLATDEEIDKFCHMYCTTRDRLPKIIQSDPIAVWLGLRPGMVVAIGRRSLTAGMAEAYRYCVKS